MNKETRQFILGIGGTLLFGSSLGTQIRTIIDNGNYSVFQWLFFSITCIGLLAFVRLIYKTI